LLGFSTTAARLAVGANDTVLTADSTAATGLKWATPAAGGMTSIASGSLSGTTTTISSIVGTYTHLYLVVNGPQVGVGNGNPLVFKLNGVGTGIYAYQGINLNSTTFSGSTGNNYISPSSGNVNVKSATNTDCYILNVENYTSAFLKNIDYASRTPSDIGNANYNGFATFNSTTAITSVSVSTEAGDRSFTAGTYILYGVK
jgi:hypothetical protein